MRPRDGRRYAPVLEVRARKHDDGSIELSSPMPGAWRDAPILGALVGPGMLVGRLEVLGVLHDLVAPEGALGVVSALPAGKRRAQRPVAAGEILARLDPEAAHATALADVAVAARASGGPVFRTPLGGRYYARPSPAAEPFVTEGDVLNGGETVALIEVMKTFNRVQIAGVKLPAKVARIVPKDGDDIGAGDVLLELVSSSTSPDP